MISAFTKYNKEYFRALNEVCEQLEKFDKYSNGMTAAINRLEKQVAKVKGDIKYEEDVLAHILKLTPVQK